MSALRKLEAFLGISLLAVGACLFGTLLGTGLLYVYINNNREAPSQLACSVNSELQSGFVTIKGVTYRAEFAETLTEKTIGLSGRDCLAPDRAMIFTYQRLGNYCYWMKNMRFPIDMVWLDADKKIITITPDVKPESYPRSFCPEKPAQYVVEVNAGTVAISGWQVGDQFSF